MKELYIAPEAELVCFAPVEEIAWENSVSLYGSSDTGTSGGGVTVPLETNPDVDGEGAPEED